MDRYQTFWARFFAGMIDGFVFIPLGLIQSRYMSSPEDGVARFLIWSVFAYSSMWLYNVVLHARYGQTIGKRVMGVKVMDVSESRLPTLTQALLRDSVYIAINAATLVLLFVLVLRGDYTPIAISGSWPGRILNWIGWAWFLTECVTMLMNDKRRALHDLIARTVVVRNA